MSIISLLRNEKSPPAAQQGEMKELFYYKFFLFFTLST